MKGKVEICGVNTAKLTVLKTATTRALLEKVRGDDYDARQALIAGNLRLVLSVIRKFAGRGESTDDLFQVGCIGLIKAIDEFNARRTPGTHCRYTVAVNNHTRSWRKLPAKLELPIYSNVAAPRVNPTSRSA